MTNPPHRVGARLRFWAICLAVFVTLAWPASVAAHTDFEASSPADGTTVDGPLSSVTLDFTNPAVESGDGFELLEPDGTVRQPSSVDPTDGTSFVVFFDPPLDAGSYGFRWDVQAGDAHPIQGSFQFTVNGSAAESAPDAAQPAATPESTTSTAPATTERSTGPNVSLDEFLAGERLPDPFAGRVARTISIASTSFAAGVMAALAWVIRGRRSEVERLWSWVRIAGLGLVAGGVAEFAALDELQATSVPETLTTKPGIAAILTVGGGLLVVAGSERSSATISAGARSLSAYATADADVSQRQPHHGTDDADDRFRWRHEPGVAVSIVGIALAIAAFSFDGHTVSKGPWIVHSIVNALHVAAGSVWVGGVFAIALVAWLRRHHRADTALAAMVVRFSSIAAISLAVLGVAGLAMAWLILDSPGEMLSTSWGRALLVKTAAVAVAAGVGGYNHVVLRPSLEARPDDPHAATRLRQSLLVESLAMVAVIVITSVLVASNT